MAFFMGMLFLRPRILSGYPTKKPCPVSNLPAELLVEIFLYVVAPSREEKHSPPTLYAPHAPSYLSCASPFSLSHVCRSWRAISLSLPRLWTSLQVVNPKSPKILPLLSLWIQRSRSHSLDLSLYQLHGHGRGEPRVPLDDGFGLECRATRQVWQLFLTVNDRWLHVDVNVCMDFRSLMDKIDGRFLGRDWSTSLPLAAIKVAFGRCESGLDRKNPKAGTLLKNHPILSDESAFFSYLLRSSPHLRSVEWDNRYVPIAFDSIGNWPTSLTDIILYGSQDVISILPGLSMCKSLRRLTIYEQTVFSPHLDHHANHYLTPSTLGNTSRKLSPLVFPVLETLRLGSFPHPELLFSHLVVPNIHSLVVLRGYNGRKGWRGLTRTSWFTLSEMLFRSHTKFLPVEIGGVALDFAAEFDGPHTLGTPAMRLRQ